MFYTDSAKSLYCVLKTCSRADVPYVFTCLCALRGYVFTYQRALRAYVLTY